jgi:signal transduction histidine kinase
MLSERRTKTLRDLASRAGRAKTSEDVFASSAQVLAEADLDLPFVLFYLVDRDVRQARLIGQTGIRPGTPVSPELVDLRVPGDQPWPIGEVARTGAPQQIDDAAGRLAGITVGPYPEVPKMAFALPITQPGSEKPAAVMVAGVSSRLLMNEPYRGFCDLAAVAVSSALANARAYEEERQKAEGLAEIDRVKTAFFSNVSHEFRTPLTLMLGPTEDALASHAQTLSGESLQMVHRNILRLMRLVNSLLDFSRIESGRAQASYEPSDLSAMTTYLASAFRSAIERAGLTFEVECESLPEPIFVDHDMWEKIVLNLLSNALKFTFDGSIGVSVRWCGDHAELKVRDTGTGIPENELPCLFERFHRVHGVRSRTHEGSGIGLALVHDLMRLHGGTVQVASRPGEGTTFTVSIPRGSAHLPPERIVAKRSTAWTAKGAMPFVEEALRWSGASKLGAVGPSAATPTPSATRADVRILVVDDNADLRDYIVGLLGEHYAVETAVDGLAALEAARLHKPALVLSDVMMPRLDGFGVLRALRADPSLRDVPVILLSARAGEDSTIEGLEAGADDYLIKPFAARELLARVRTHVELGRQREAVTRAKDAAEAANRELESFSYSIAHDLRAPLRSMNGFSHALLEDYTDKFDVDGKKYLSFIRESAQRMGQLIDDLLALSRITQSELHREGIDLSALARAAITRLQRSQPDRRVEVVIQEGLRGEGDPRLLTVALDNLFGNAWKFTGKCDAARIEFGANSNDGHRMYFVRDNGVGFDMRYSKKLFGVFQRLHRAEEYAGTGVGLSIVQRVISRHGGRVWADSRPGEGATFYFTLEPG